TLSDADKAELFAYLKRDKERGRSGGGLLFLPSARAALLEAGSDPSTRRAAAQFLDAWLTSPVASPHRGALGYRQRMRLSHDLAYIPIPEISTAAITYVDDPQRK